MDKRALLGIAIFLIVIPIVFAQTVSHTTEQIKPGTFQSGNYTFPSDLIITNLLNVALVSVHLIE